MVIIRFNLDNKKYMLEFLEGNRAKISRLEDKDKFITVKYSSDTKVTDLIKYIKSLDF